VLLRLIALCAEYLRLVNGTNLAQSNLILSCFFCPPEERMLRHPCF